MIWKNHNYEIKSHNYEINDSLLRKEYMKMF